MKYTVGMLIAAVTLSLPICSVAQEAIVGLSPSTRAQIDIYAEPSVKSSVRQISTKDLVFPLPVTKAKAGFLAVKLDGESYWLRSAHVRVKRASTAKCAPLIASATPNNSTPGAGATGCR